MSNQSLYFSAHSVDELPPFTMDDIVDYLPSMATQWKTIGIKLGLTTVVKSLKNSTESDDSKLMEILWKWEESGSASWQVLFDVLNSKGVQLVGVANEIKQVRNDIVQSNLGIC